MSNIKNAFKNGKAFIHLLHVVTLILKLQNRSYMAWWKQVQT